MTIKLLSEILCSRGNKLSPCNAGDIEYIEQKLKTKLPEEYLEFLLTMGRGAGKFMLGSDVFIDELLTLKEGALEIIDENNLPPLPPNAFVFWMHQGYQFAFFETNEKNQLDIYFFSEGNNMKNYKFLDYSLAEFFYKQLDL